ncbi:MAG: DUF1360 domain-containing protein [Armatimonadetes bacterium]|nr:DUF1360 domain-containing protein [Armatimonadota bacterium]
MKDSRHPWFLAIIFTFVAMTGAVLKVRRTGTGDAFTPLNLLLLGLASYRAGRVIALDDVTQPFRLPFVDVQEENGERKETPKKEGLPGAIGALITCPDCIGFWIAAVLAYGSLLWSGPVRVVTLALGASGLSQFLNAIVMFLAKHAHEK